MTPAEFNAKYGQQGAATQALLSQQPGYQTVFTKQGSIPLDQYEASFKSQPKKQTGNFFQRNLNNIGGAAGSLGALGIGALLAPETGGLSLIPALLAAGAGGAVGGGLGEAAKEKSLGQKVNAGEIAKQVGIQGAFGAGGELGGELLGLGVGALAGKGGSRLTEAASGFKLGKGVGNVAENRLASDIYATHSLTGTPREILTKTPKVMGDISGQVDKLLAKSPKGLQGSTVVDAIKQGIKDPTKFGELTLGDPATQKVLQSHFDVLSKLKTPQAINDYVKTLNPLATNARTAEYLGKSLTAKQSAALAVKRGIDEAISGVSNEVAPLKQAMAVMFHRTPEITAAAEQGVKLPFGLNRIPGANSLAQGARGVGSRVGALAQGGGGRLSQALGALGSQTIPRAALSPGSRPQDQSSQGDQASQYAADPTNPQFNGVDPAQFGYPADNTLQGGQMAQSNQQGQLAQALQQAMLQDLQQTGGKRIPALKSVYDTLTAASKPPKQTAAQSAAQDSVLSALGSLDAAHNNIKQYGGLRGPIGGQAAKVPLVGQLLDRQGAELHHTRIEIATALEQIREYP